MDAVLIADDDALVRSVLRAALERRGVPVAEAGNGDELLALLDEADYGLCIMDARMPGATLQTRLDRLRDVAPSLPVIVLTGFAEERNTAGRPGVRFARKPIDLGALDTVLAEAALSGAER